MTCSEEASQAEDEGLDRFGFFLAEDFAGGFPALSRISSASLNFNGLRESGFALGMLSPWALQKLINNGHNVFHFAPRWREAASRYLRHHSSQLPAQRIMLARDGLHRISRWPRIGPPRLFLPRHHLSSFLQRSGGFHCGRSGNPLFRVPG